MQQQRVREFLPLLFLMVIKVNSEFQGYRGLNVYDIELWHEMRNAPNNNETSHFSKHVGPIEQNRRTFDLWEDILFCGFLWDCDDSSEEEQDVLSSLFPSPQPIPQSSLIPVALVPMPLVPAPLVPAPLVPAPLVPAPLVPATQPLANNCPHIPEDYSRFQCITHAYKFHKEQLSWAEAQLRCQKESAQLVVIENGAQYDSVMQLAKREMGGGVVVFHAGFRRESVTDPWKTVYGNSLSFEKWASCQPNDRIGDENCGGFIFFPNGPEGLNYGACDLQYSYMCEIKVPSGCT